ncbi:MAG: AmpG family muropeptide MFS transporter [Rhodoferax sp.]
MSQATTTASSPAAGDAAAAAAPATPARSWREVLAALWDRRVLAMLLLGFSAGLPLLLIFSSLSLWLGEAGVERKAVTYFSWAALGYSFKFVWAPLVDRLPLPLLGTWLGRRRSWLLLAQGGVVCAIVGMANTDPAQGPQALGAMALWAVLLGFSSATQDVVIDAYRIEVAEARQQGLLSSAYIAGYRVAMILAGAGVLLLAAHLGTAKGQYLYEAWRSSYLAMAACMGLGVLTTLLVREPAVRGAQAPAGAGAPHWGQHLRLFVVFAAGVGAFVAAFIAVGQWWPATGAGPVLALLQEAAKLGAGLASAVLAGAVLVRWRVAEPDAARSTWVAPVQDFFARYGARTAWLLLGLIGLYRISDIVLGVISNVFYQDLGFSKEEIAFAVKTFGVFMSILGAFVGGLLVLRLGVMRSLWWGAVLSALSNLAFIALAQAGHEAVLLYAVVGADNLAAGFASAAFVALLSSLVNVSFTATQYAIFSSLMTLLPKTLGGYSGTLVDALGYPGFFLFTTLIGVPVLALVWWASRALQVRDPGVGAQR